jgi:hypothetical protein
MQLVMVTWNGVSSTNKTLKVHILKYSVLLHGMKYAMKYNSTTIIVTRNEL